MVYEPAHRGFGSELIELLTRQLGGEVGFEWRAQGLLCEFHLPASTLAPTQAAAE